MIKVKFKKKYIFYDKNILTESYHIFLYNTKKLYKLVNENKLVNKNKLVNENKLVNLLILYNYIYLTSSLFFLIGKEFKKQTNILKYKPYNSFFFNVYEVLYKYKILKDCKNILELSSNPIIYESVQYYETKYKKNKSNYDSIFFSKFYNLKINKNEAYYFYKNKIKVNMIEYDGYFNENFIKENINKYDVIYSNLSNNLSYFKEDFIEHSNIQLIFNIFLYSILRLNINGNLIISINSVTTKPMADILIIGKMMFKEVILYQPKIHMPFKKSGTVIIFKNFIEIKEEEKLFEIFRKLYENDPTSQNFNVDTYNKKYEDVIIDKIKHKNNINKIPLYIDNFLDLDSSDKQYDFIREFNKKRYYDSSQYMEKTLDIVSKGDEYVENFKKEFNEVQFTRSVLWAKEFDMDILPFYQKGFNDVFGSVIMKDLYSYHEPIIFKFKKYDSPATIELSDKIHKSVNEFLISSYMIDTRDSERYNKAKFFVRFYKPKNKPHLQLGNYLKDKIGINHRYSQAWIKMYEILTLFNLFDKNKNTLKTFHMCELPGEFIMAINHYAFTKTNVKKFEWNAQSCYPITKENDCVPDTYGLKKRNENKWHVENGGNLMNVENIKSYKKYCTDIDLLTSDCGVGWGNTTLTKLDFAQVIAILYLLPVGKNFVAKFVLPIKEPIIHNSIYLLYLHFKELIFYKSVQNTYSGEFYIIGKDYKGIDTAMMELLFKSLENYDDDLELNTKYMYEYIIQLENVLDKMTNNFTFAIDRQLYYTDNFELLEKCNKGKCHLDEIDNFLMEKNKDWFETFNPIRLDKKYDL